MDSAGVPLLYPLDSNSSPWGYPLRRGTLAAAVYTNTDIACIRCYRLSPVPNIVQLSVFGSVSRAFQSGCWVVVVRFSLLGGGAVRSCGYVGFCYGLSLDLR